MRYLKFSMLFLLLISLGCEKEKYEEDCRAPILDFKIEQLNSFTPDSLLECTKCMEGYIKFSIIDSTAEVVKWKIGNDAREFTDRSFRLLFQDVVGQKLPITLYIEKFTESNECEVTYYKDSITKTLEFISYFDSQIFGKYRGYNSDDPNHEFVVELIDTVSVTDLDEVYDCGLHHTPPFGVAYRVIKGIPETCRDVYVCHGPLFTPSYDKFYFDSKWFTDECLSVNGRGYLDENDPNRIIIFYKTFVSNTQEQGRIEKERKFIGYRMN